MSNTDDYNGLTLPPHQSYYIWISAWTSIPSFLYARYTGHNELSIVPLSVYISSMIYWHNPIKYSWRRYLDMTVVLSGLGYQVYSSRNSKNLMYYYPVLFLGMTCFPLSTYVRKKYPDVHIGPIWGTTLLHCMVHIIGNIANIILYSGSQS